VTVTHALGPPSFLSLNANVLPGLPRHAGDLHYCHFCQFNFLPFPSYLGQGQEERGLGLHVQLHRKTDLSLVLASLAPAVCLLT
jgi:hypothetical protein